MPTDMQYVKWGGFYVFFMHKYLHIYDYIM